MVLARAAAVLAVTGTACALLASAGCAATLAGGRAVVVPGALTSLCAGQAPTAITVALSHVVPASRRHEVVPLGISADGRTAYVSIWTAAFSGVAALALRGGALRPIERFPDPVSDQADGAWGGRWLVWEQTHSLQSLDGFTVLAWDSVTGRIMRLGRSLRSPAGRPWPSPWHPPAVSGEFTAWAQGDGPGGDTEIRLADLRTGQVTVVRRGHLQAPFFDGRLLVWPESDAPGAPTTLRAYDPAAGRLVALPAPLTSVRGTDLVASDGVRTAYVNASLTKLYYSPDPSTAASVVLRLPPGQEFSGVSVGRGVLAWTTTRATYLASTGTGRYLQVTRAYGFAVTGQGSSVLVADPPARKSGHPVLPVHVVDSAAIGGPACENVGQ